MLFTKKSKEKKIRVLPCSPFFARQEKRIFLFFLCGHCGDPVQNRPQNPAPAGCLCSTRKSRLEVPERGGLGEENCLGKGGVDRAKKGKKGCAKKRWPCFHRASREQKRHIKL